MNVYINNNILVFLISLPAKLIFLNVTTLDLAVLKYITNDVKILLLKFKTPGVKMLDYQADRYPTEAVVFICFLLKKTIILFYVVKLFTYMNKE